MFMYKQNRSETMGNTGSGLKKLRKSLRRISLSRSREHLNRGDKVRRSTSLMNLSIFRKNNMQKKKSQSTTVISDTSRDQEVSKNEEGESVSIVEGLGSPIVNIHDANPKRHELSSSPNRSDCEEETKLDSKKFDEKTTKDRIIDNPKKADDEMISNRENLADVISDNSVSPRFKKHSTNETNPVSRIISGRHDCSGVIALRKIDETIRDIEQQIEQMPHEDLLVHLSTFKDEIHRLWKKSYEVKATSTAVNPKKVNTIEYAKRVLHKLYSKAFKQHDYRVTETNM